MALASGDMALIEQGGWKVLCLVSAPLSIVFLLVLLFNLVRHDLIGLDWTRCHLLSAHSLRHLLSLVPDEQSHLQSSNEDW